MTVVFGTNYKNPTAVIDSNGIGHVHPEGQEHELHPACWCFPVRRLTDTQGRPMKREVHVHRDFPKRGNA